MANRPAKRKPKTTDSDVQIAVAKWRSISQIARTFFYCSSAPMTVWAAKYVAAELAGRTTALNIAVTATVAISLSITTAGALGWGRHHKKRADAARGRIGKLEGERDLLKAERDSLERRNGELERDIVRKRAQPAKRT